MDIEIDELLILSSEPDFQARLGALRREMLLAARFAGHDSAQSRTVAEVLDAVAQRGDQAVSEYTQKFDKAALRPEQFRISGR